MTTRIRGIYEAVLAGDPITDGEIDYAIAFFTRVRGDLAGLGPVFHLASTEAARVLQRLEGFKEARKPNEYK